MMYPGKRVMFYLIIQSAHIPVYKEIAGRKVRCSLYLVNRPFILDHFVFHTLGRCKFNMLHHMSQLEYKRQGQAHRYMHTGKTNGPWSPANKINRNSNIDHCIKDFTKPKNNMLFGAHFLQWRSMYFPREIFIKIHYKYPGKRRDRIHQYDIDMLEAVSRHPFL